jgi:hypothetical protein
MTIDTTAERAGGLPGLDEFREFYESRLRPVLEELERRRRQAIGRFWKICLFLVAAVIVGFLIFPIFRAAPFFIIFGAAAALVVAVISWVSLTKDLTREFKRRVVGEVVRFVDPSLVYSPEGHISRSQFRGSGIFLHGIDRFRGEDHVGGVIGKTRIEFSELHAQYKTTTHTKNGTRTTWHTIFKGLFFIADFNKHFRGRTYVLTDVAEGLFGFIGKKLQEMNFTRPDLIKLEDPEFEEEFVVYGDDQVEARYILSTSLMQRILDFRRKTARNIQLSFVGSNVHVAIPMTRDMFEPRMTSSFLDFGLVRDYLLDLQFACGIVDDLNLNTRIWTKE